MARDTYDAYWVDENETTYWQGMDTDWDENDPTVDDDPDWDDWGDWDE